MSLRQKTKPTSILFACLRLALVMSASCAGIVLCTGIAPTLAQSVAGPAAASASAGPTSNAAPTIPAGKVFRIVAFGSSSTEGIGASQPNFAYPAQVERMLNEGGARGLSVSVVNRGIGGEDIDDMIGRLRADVLARKPDLVIWQVGSNDPLRGVPLERFVSELRSGIAAIREAGVEVVLMEPQWCQKIAEADGRGNFREAVRSVGLAEKVIVIRRYELMRQWLDKGLVTPTTLVGPDGLHMTDRGYSLLARAVSEEIVGSSLAYRAGRQRALLAMSAGRS